MKINRLCKYQKSRDRLTAFARPGVEDLVGVASSVGEESVLAVVVEGTGVVQGRIVPVRLSVATVSARSCKCMCKNRQQNVSARGSTSTPYAFLIACCAGFDC